MGVQSRKRNLVWPGPTYILYTLERVAQGRHTGEKKVNINRVCEPHIYIYSKQEKKKDVSTFSIIIIIFSFFFLFFWNLYILNRFINK